MISVFLQIPVLICAVYFVLEKVINSLSKFPKLNDEDGTQLEKGRHRLQNTTYKGYFEHMIVVRKISKLIE